MDETVFYILQTIPPWLVSIAAFLSALDLFIVAIQNRDATMIGSVMIRVAIAISYAYFGISRVPCDTRGAIIRTCILLMMMNDGISRFMLFLKVRKLILVATDLDKKEFNQGGLYFLIAYIWHNRDRLLFRKKREEDS